MDGARSRGWVAAAGRITRRLHAGGVSAQQRLHRPALLMAVAVVAAALPLHAGDFDFTTVTQQEFRTFSRVVGQGIFATPVQPARAGSIISFDAGVAATVVQVDTNPSFSPHPLTRHLT